MYIYIYVHIRIYTILRIRLNHRTHLLFAKGYNTNALPAIIGAITIIIIIIIIIIINF